MFIQGSGKMTRQRAMARIIILMDKSFMKGSGRMTCSMEEARRFGMMVPYLRAIISRVRKPEWVNLYGRKKESTKGNY